ncbi:MAG: terpene cyclase/mutase family protein [Planctomycetota bacterium]|nr:terpene cyclase/mutase family protein [Planctomycetota bacterium]
MATAKGWLGMAGAILLPMSFAAMAAGGRAEGGEEFRGTAKELRDTVLAKAVRFLTERQNADGSYGKFPSVGQTALVVYALAESPRAYRYADGPFMSKAVDFILANQREDGAIVVKGQGLENYNTSVAIMALCALQDPKYRDVIEKAKKFVLGCQCTPDKEYDKDKHPNAFGGFRYGTSEKPDLSNTQFALEALKMAGVPEDSEVWKNVLVFVRRCQDNAETNDLPIAKDGAGSGGGYYGPDRSEMGMVTTREGKKVPKPYGAMTYAMVKSFLYAGLKKDSPEVQAALKWIRNNWSVSENPGAGANGMEGLYYYYHTFAKTMYLVGDSVIEDKDGNKHNWARELAGRLASLQKEDGSFVNSAPRWMESDPVLCTAYAVCALNYAYRDIVRQEAAGGGK